MSSKISRRKFIHTACAATCGAAIHRAFDSGSSSMLAYAKPPTMAANGNRLTVVFLFLGGGASIQLANPTNPTYLGINPTIAYNQPGQGPRPGLPMSSEQVLHPALTFFKQMFDQGKLAAFGNCGAPTNTRSHDIDTDTWLTGHTDNPKSKAGLGANLVCNIGMQGLLPLVGVSFNNSDAFSEGANCQNGASITSINSLSNTGDNFWLESSKGREFLDAIRNNSQQLGAPFNHASQLYVKKNIDDYYSLIKTLSSATSNIPNVVTYPQTGLGNSLRDIARLIRARLVNPALLTQVFKVVLGGFDTHANELGSLAGLAGQLNAAVSAFFQDINLAGLGDEVVLVTMSEFGRTLRENGSQGSDHGRGSTMFVMSNRVNGGLKRAITEQDIIDNLQYNYLRNVAIDFRDVLSHVIAAMNIDPGPIFPPHSKVVSPFMI